MSQETILLGDLILYGGGVVVGSFLLPSGLRLLLEVEYVVEGMHFWSAKMSTLFRLAIISALITRCFVVECKVRPVLTYLRNPILATR